jgi:hypothetical protein
MAAARGRPPRPTGEKLGRMLELPGIISQAETVNMGPL